MSKYQALIDALKAGPTEGKWVADDNEGFSPWSIWSRMSPTGHGEAGPRIAQIQSDSAEGDANAAYIAAANPATIRSLLADLERAEKALDDAATSLETISRLAGKERYPNGDVTCMGSFPEVRGYAISRAGVARAALSQIAGGGEG